MYRTRAAARPQALVEPVSDALIDELDALSVSRRGRRRRHRRPNRRCSANPACRRRKPAGTLDAARAVRRRGRRRAAAALLLAQDWAAGVHLQALRRGGRAGLGAAHAVAVRAGRDHARVLDRAELARAAARRAPGHPPRPRPGLRHRHAPDDTHVPALDARRPPMPALDRVLDYGCGSGILAIGAALLGARGVDAVDIDPAAVQATRDNARPTAWPLRPPACPTPAQRRLSAWCWPTSWPRR